MRNAYYAMSDNEDTPDDSSDWIDDFIRIRQRTLDETLTQAHYRGLIHPCPGNCGRNVSKINFACKICWNRLPKDIRDGIWAVLKEYESAAMSVFSMALDWYKENPTP